MKLAGSMLASVFVVSLVSAVIITVPYSSALETAPVTESQTTPATGAETSPEDENIVLLDDAAFTDEPKLGELPESGASLAPVAIGITGGLTALLGYASIHLRSARD